MHGENLKLSVMSCL